MWSTLMLVWQHVIFFVWKVIDGIIPARLQELFFLEENVSSRQWQQSESTAARNADINITAV